jgi:hypothetical protein
LKNKTRDRDWLLLGAAHAAAFLAKDFALPWLALTTLFAGRKGGRSLALAFLLPALAYAGWGLTLRAKYGVFMSGCAAKQTLIERRGALAGPQPAAPRGLEAVHDCEEANLARWDRYVVFEPLPPGSTVWAYRAPWGELARALAANAGHYFPRALFSLARLAGPAALALLFAGPLDAFSALVLFSCVSLLSAYSLIGWYDRYALPLVPLVIAAALARLGTLPRSSRRSWWGVIAACLLLPRLFGAPLPFGIYGDEAQAGIRDAADKMRGAATAVVLGSGPLPRLEIGYQAGLMAAFLAGARVVGYQPSLLAGSPDVFARDAARLAPDAVLVLGPDARTEPIAARVKGYSRRVSVVDGVLLAR